MWPGADDKCLAFGTSAVLGDKAETPVHLVCAQGV